MDDDRKEPDISSFETKVGSTSTLRSERPVKVTLKYKDGGQVSFKMHPGFEVEIVQGTTPYDIVIYDLDTDEDLHAVN